MRNSSYTYRFRGPMADPALRGGAAPVYRRTTDLNMIIERDVPVRLRDGVTMYVDVCRPEDEAPAAPIIGWGPYGKHGHTRYATVFPNAGVNQDALSPYTAFEALDPVWWVPKGYAIINPDPRGTWHSQGRATYVSPEETRDFCDLIQWAGTQALVQWEGRTVRSFLSGGSAMVRRGRETGASGRNQSLGRLV
jgi:predicted acyl esterase